MIILNSALGRVDYVDQVVPDPEKFLKALLQEIPFASEQIMMFGKKVTVPRLVSWHGESGIHYRYSGTDHVTLPWTPTLLTLKELVEKSSGATYNAVLLNLYRSGQDYMSWHADDEKELGKNPTIASLSLGSERIFEFKKKLDKKPEISLILKSGSLLIMSGDLQTHYHHRLKKEAKINGIRINLTFRKIF